MNKEEIKAILASARADRQDDADPQVAAAKAATTSDAELSAWAENERAFDAAFSAKVQEAIVPPAELKAKILSSQAQPEQEEPTNVIRVPFFRNPAILSMAAAIAVLLMVIGISFNPNTASANTDASLEAFYSMAANKVSNGEIKPTYFDESVANLDQHLKTENAPNLDGSIAEKMAKASGVGCMTINWNGKPVSVVCVSGDSVFHIFVVDKSTLPNCNPPVEPVYEQRGEIALVKWSSEDRVYVMVGVGHIENARKLM